MNGFHNFLPILLQGSVVFVISFLSDVFWGLYIRRTNEGRALAAANYAAIIMAFAAANVISYTKNIWMLIPIISGNWLGTFWIVKTDHKHE